MCCVSSLAPRTGSCKQVLSASHFAQPAQNWDPPSSVLGAWNIHFPGCRESDQEPEAHSRQLPAHLASLLLLDLPEPFPFSLCFQRKAENLLLLLEAYLHPPLVFPGARLPTTPLLSPHRPSDRGQNPCTPSWPTKYLPPPHPAPAVTVLLPRKQAFSI